MTVLGIETSTLVCGVGIADAHGLRIERSLEEAHIHSEKLLTLLNGLLNDARIDLRRIDAIAVSNGPGSFTGLRIGLSTAKGLCYALDKPLVLVPTFEAVAAAAAERHPGARIIVFILDAKKGDFYTGRFAVEGGTVQAIRQVEVVSHEHIDLPARSDSETFVISDRVGEVQRKLPVGIECRDVLHYCRPAIVAQRGIARASRGEFADLPSAEPMYWKDFIVKASVRT